MHRLLTAAALALLATTAHADAIGDLRTALHALAGTKPVRAAYERRDTNVSRGRFFDGDSAANGAAVATIDADGLTVMYPRTHLEAVRAQTLEEASGAKKPDRKRPRAGEASPMRIAELLDYAPALEAMLHDAKLLEDRAVTFRGQPARLIVVQPVVNVEGMKEGHFKQKSDRLSIWLGADRVPLAAERVGSYTAGFLFLHIDFTSKDSWTFAHRDDRLIVTRHDRNSATEGLGQKSNSTEVETVVVR